MLRARRISPRDSRRSGMPLNVDGWCEVVLQLTDGVRSAIGEEREHMRLALRKTHVGQKFLESHSRRGSPLHTPRRFCCAGPPGRSLKLSDSIVPEALLSDGQEFVRVSRSSALVQMIARLDELLISS